jgi:hypothetical protein
VIVIDGGRQLVGRDSVTDATVPDSKTTFWGSRPQLELRPHPIILAPQQVPVWKFIYDCEPQI